MSPPASPLRTVLEIFTSHGSSKSLTARILKIISRRAFLTTTKLPLGFLLVAVQVYQFPVATHIRATRGSGQLVVAVQFLTVDEVHSAQSADPVLVVGKLHVPGG